MKQTTKNIQPQEITIDARGKKLGRLSSEVAKLLMGKENPSFRKHLSSGVKVTVTDSSKLDIHPRKLSLKRYTRYTGYPGGLREEKMENVIAKKGYGELIRRAVYGMLPTNKLRKIRMKSLIVKE